MIRGVNGSVLWRAALIQALAVAALSMVLAIALPHTFFENWGWIAGPAAWIACALFTARVLHLPYVPALLGAAGAGLVSVVAVLAGVHWLGAAIAVGLFACWCARLGRDQSGALGTSS